MPWFTRLTLLRVACLKFVRLFSDVPVTAAHYPHLYGPPGAFRAPFYSDIGDLPGAIAAAGFTGLASASASASAHRASPSWVYNDESTVSSGEKGAQSAGQCPTRFGLLFVSYSLENSHHYKLLTLPD